MLLFIIDFKVYRFYFLLQVVPKSVIKLAEINIALMFFRFYLNCIDKLQILYYKVGGV